MGTRPLEPFLLRTRLIIAALLATFFLCLSSSINPIIYNFTNGEFRREFRKCSVFAVKEQELSQRRPLWLLTTISWNGKSEWMLN